MAEKVYRASTTAPVNIAVVKYACRPHPTSNDQGNCALPIIEN
jgi:hypothetical protein